MKKLLLCDVSAILMLLGVVLLAGYFYLEDQKGKHQTHHYPEYKEQPLEKKVLAKKEVLFESASKETKE